jgi:hypothetical protein
MDDNEDQGQGGGLFETVREKGREYLSDPQHREEIGSQAQERFGNVPGMDRVTGAMGQVGEGAGSSGDQSSGGYGDQGAGQDQFLGGQDQSFGGEGQSSDAEQDQYSDQSQY